MTAERTIVISCRVSEKFANIIKKYCKLDMHINPADLMRDALREKIERDFPELYRQIVKEQS